jgi:hypothetical protein
MVYYNTSKDRSEEFGWKKVCDEHIPSKEEQTKGSILILSFTVGIILTSILGGSYGIL